MKTRLLLILATLAISTPSFAQLATPNAAGAAIGHIHINATDVEAQSRFWTAVGGQLVQRDKLPMIRNSTNTSGLRIVFITDPWGTEIELTEGLASTPLGGSR